MTLELDPPQLHLHKLNGIVGFWLGQFGNREDIDDQEKKEANEGSNESSTAMVTKGLELVTDFVPPCM